MKYSVNAREMKLIDDYTIQHMKISQNELMERAAAAIVAVMTDHIKKTDRILVVCGSGNNGGDGIAAGRILYLQGYQVAILFVGEEDRISEGFKTQMEIARNSGLGIENHDKLDEYNIIIDAIFGVGLSRPITGRQEEIINRINKHSGVVYAVDIPSGISADNGKVMNVAVRADYTITFGHQKQGLLLYPGADYAGNITIADIGFPEEATKKVAPDTFYYEPEDLDLLPPRKNYSNKGTFGKVLVIAGSLGMSGAAYLSAKAAYRTGAGLVKVLTAEENRIILQTSLPEALFGSYESGENKEEWKQRLLKDLSWAGVIVIGPGIGLSEGSMELLELVLEYAEVPVILDGDGLTLLAAKLDQQFSKRLDIHSLMQSEAEAEAIVTERLHYLSSMVKTQVILTPHLKELSRLIQKPITDIVNNLVDTARQCSYNNNLVCIIKDARTIIAQGDRKYMNISGNNGMATGGSGDVLTGILAALLVQGLEPYMAGCLGAYLHGLAGDFAADAKGKYSLMASDIVDSIEKVLNRETVRRH